LLRPDDLDDAIALLRTHEIVLAPARDGGTGAVVTRADAGFSPAFGRRSFARHADAARARGLTVAIFDGSSLGEDVDRPEDLRTVLAHGSPTRTAAFLRDRLLASGVLSEGLLTRVRTDPG
jgi:2-phospho-L-lactate guanylyltransferase (CobY/MobA/RfbA family)